jgi:hypothetical protein
MMPIMEVTSSARKSVCREWIMGTPPHTAASKLKLRDRDRDRIGWDRMERVLQRRGCYRGEGVTEEWREEGVERRRSGEEIECSDGVKCAKIEWPQLRMDRR